MDDLREPEHRDRLLCAHRISHNFGNVEALRNVTVSLEHREVVGLLGNNGAGKSTLVKILAGNFRPDAGEIYFEGRRVAFSNPEDAIVLGIETKYQNLDLIDHLSVYRNFFLGKEVYAPHKRGGPRALRRIDRRSMIEQTRAQLAEIGIDEKGFVHRAAGSLSGGERQTVLIARAMHFGRKLVVLDEPTISLSASGVQKLLETMSKAKSRGLSILFVTHNATEAFDICDRFVLLQSGTNFAEFKKEETNINELEKLFIFNKLSAMQERAAAAAHQLNNPLAIMKVAAQMLDDKLRPDPNLHKLVDVIGRKIETLQTIVRRYLDYARPLKSQRRFVRLSELVDHVLEDMIPETLRGITVDTSQVDPDAGTLMDQSLMEQALTNLLLNAIESSESGGAVSIRGRQNGERLVIEVADEGHGMDEQTRRQIFDYFYTTKSTGTGLGLVIVRQIVQQHRGTIEVETEPGCGSIFRVEI